MSRLIKIFQKLKFIDNSIQDSDDDSNIPVFNSTQEVPKDTNFVTSRIIQIPFPDESIMKSFAGYFNTYYSRKFMVWNLSEKLYASEIFNGQVLDFVFLGYPNPPLNEIFAIFNSISGWLDSDSDNVAVVHCQSTNTRSYMLISCYLAWQNHESPLQTFQKLTASKHILLIPSQIRYMEYINQIIKGSKPLTKTLKIRKIIITGMPTHKESIRPYFQFFKSGSIIYSSLTGNLPKLYQKEELSWCYDLDLEVTGDVLFRCKDGNDSKKETIFRVMFHTAFTDEFSIRFFKYDLDAVQEHFDAEFMVDVFFVSQEGDKTVVPGNLKKHQRAKKEHEEEEEEKIDRELLEKYKEHIEDSDEDEDEDLDDYFQKLEGNNK